MSGALWAFLWTIGAGAASAADGAVTRTIFDRMDVPPGYEAVVGSAMLPPGSTIGRHTHHGMEFGYVVEGELEILLDGKPPLRLKAGSFYKIEPGQIHDARPIGATARAVATWVVEKGKPLSSPAK